MRFQRGQYQFKVLFAIYSDFEAILQEEVADTVVATGSATKQINHHNLSRLCTYRTCAYGEVKDPLKLYQGKDCVEVFCKYIKEEVKRLYHMFLERPMKSSTQEEWRDFKGATKCHICFNDFEENDKFNFKVRDHFHYMGLYRGPA